MSKEDNIKKALEEFQDFTPTEGQIEKIETLKDIYADKSDEEIFFEIIRINEDMEKEMTEEEYEEIFEKLNSIRPLLNEEQLQKLDRILYILGK
ncbi:hypothetical protein [Clostridium sp. Cult3]|uniref:hypothetical protein n=1 Tax=Clostridium sp. Cult3 TaxID=2079004 RepID=UPI001F1AA1AC|nr:hypothetical protein [Clostridium sp. Cult3]MCF6459800.1 hypothetical protein [Clostridium sp. Cult3]